MSCTQHPSPAEIKSRRGLAFWLPGSAKLLGRERALCCEGCLGYFHTGFMSGLGARLRICLPAVCLMNLLRVKLETDDKQGVKSSQLSVGIKRVAVTEMG